MAAAVRVEKATSDLLLGPDWTLNIDICDDANSDHGQAKEVIKTLKKRLQHKNSSVQFLALTLLETLVKNCGDHVHFLVVERGILPEMIKVAKKKANVQVRDKILTLLDSWQEAFGGPGGKHPQFYWAYSELKQSGLEFPRRSPEAATIFAPHLQPGIGMPVSSSLRADEMISSSGSPLSLSDLQRILSAAELLSEMLREVNPNDHEAVNDEIIAELVNQCRSYQKKIMSLVSSVSDEDLLSQSLDLNDRLQILLSKHDAIASGSPLPAEETDVLSELPRGITTTPAVTVVPETAIVPTFVLADEEEEEEDDEFSQLARRNSRFRAANEKSASSGVGASSSSMQDGTASSAAPVTTSAPPSTSSSALSLPEHLAPIRTSPEEKIMSDLLALTIVSSPSPEPALHHGGSPTSYHPQPRYVDPEHTAAAQNSYVAPWAQHQSQTGPIKHQHQQQQPPPQSQFSYNPSPYPPPPWDPQDNTESNPFVASSSQHLSTSSSPLKVPSNMRPLQQSQSFGVPLRSAVLNSPTNKNLKQPMSAGSRRPSYVPSNKFFDDLLDRNADGTLKTGSTVIGGTSSPYKP
ncbi:TOM1-like protein 6 isoform X1 [Hordeum vulgare subsp. vulgare]|uniref:VHS domain-containing protein n=2 Tax=Hordeum vulgare subsp. vulgare TaxID=112509 RepID=A0A8I6Z1N0_HORVV|nr:TOM1-like protein 6 isoform X1 [Hordeum vulgare subsp. vulgare]